MALPCPSCRVEMDEQSFKSHGTKNVALDLCHGCNALWFDDKENLALSAGGTLHLFELMHVERTKPTPLADALACPRCEGPLKREMNMVHGVRYTMYRCRERHGQLITFYEFLREKNFIKPLTGDKLKQLREQVRTVNCSNCGAPIDVQATSACEHCKSPLALLDPDSVDAMITKLRTRAEAQDDHPTEDALKQEKVMAEFFRIKSQHEKKPDGLIEIGIGLLLEVLVTTTDLL